MSISIKIIVEDENTPFWVYRLAKAIKNDSNSVIPKKGLALIDRRMNYIKNEMEKAIKEKGHSLKVFKGENHVAIHNTLKRMITIEAE